MLAKILSLSRRIKQFIMMLVDSIFILLSTLISFHFSLISLNPYEFEMFLVLMMGPPLAVLIFIKFGLYHSVIRYIGYKAVFSIIKAVSSYILIWGALSIIITSDQVNYSTVFINWTFTILTISGLRVFAIWLINDSRARGKSFNKSNILIYGSGIAGVQLLSALKHSLNYEPVGLIDDAIELQGIKIMGLDVFSSEKIPKLIKNLDVREIFIAIPSASRAERATIVNNLEKYPVHVKILPSMTSLAQQKIKVSDLRDVDINDLLGRQSVEFDENLLSKNILGKTVLVTGAGGSIGSELCRQIVQLKPKVLILFEVSEHALYKIEMELSEQRNDKLGIYPVLGSITNKIRLKSIFKKFNVDTVYHAAAYKHVPMIEFNTLEGVQNNIFGTLNCVQVAVEEHVNTFVLVSTDKAVRPSNTMGATKRVAELILQAYSMMQHSTKFTMVRFGNVIGSSGSVIPLFKKQIESGGPVTVTNADIIRYFMTISEAVKLLIQAGTMSLNGDVFVLDMGKPVRIDDLAKKMIRLSGLQLKNELKPLGDIEIRYVGLRPGEKLFEELLIGDNVTKTIHPLILRANEDSLDWIKLKSLLDEMNQSVLEGNVAKIRELLIRLVPEFRPQSDICDYLY